MHRGVRQRQGGIALLLLAMEIMRIGVENIPVVTLSTVAAQTAIFLHILNIKWFQLPVRDVCISVRDVYYYNDYQRLILGAIYHADDWHLYYNMASLLWKGRVLEPHFGSGYFAYLLCVFSVLTSVILVGLNMVIGWGLEEMSYLYTCAVGFSGVIFALKVLCMYYSPPSTMYIMGWLPVPSRYAVWAELLVIQVLVPNASFMGHLAGILVGLLYVHGPLKFVMNLLWPFGYIAQYRQYTEPRYTYTSGVSGRRERVNGEYSTNNIHNNYQRHNDNYNQNFQPRTPTAPPGEDYLNRTSTRSNHGNSAEYVRNQRMRYYQR